LSISSINFFLLDRLNIGVKCWESFSTAQKSVDSWIREARAMIAVRHIDSTETVEMHRQFFTENNIDEMMKQYLLSAQELEPFLADQSKVPLGSEIRKHQEAW